MEKRNVKSTVINSILILLAVLLFLFFSYTYGEKQELGNMKPNYVSGLTITMFYVGPVWLVRRHMWKKKRKQQEEQARRDFFYSREGQRTRVHMTDNDLALIDSGSLPNVFGTGIVLKANEQAYFNATADLLTSTERVVGHKGSSGGVSVRVARGVSVHSGSHTSTPIYGRVQKTYNGQFVITNERIIFINALKGFEVAVTKITAITPYNDGIGIQAGSKAYKIMLPYNDYAIKVLNMMRLY